MTDANLRTALAKLKALCGTHDQTMRTQAIEIMFGPRRLDQPTPTERFLEYTIAWHEEQLRIRQEGT